MFMCYLLPEDEPPELLLEPPELPAELLELPELKLKLLPKPCGSELLFGAGE
jgi:hypothetical protein